VTCKYGLDAVLTVVAQSTAIGSAAALKIEQVSGSRGLTALSGKSGEYGR
jgi:hypothetical protein